MRSEPAQTGNFWGVRTEDEQTLDTALEILAKYEEVLRYDDVLTHGARRREYKLETRLSGRRQ